MCEDMTVIKSNNRLKNIEAIFFDFGGTLYDIDNPVIDIWRDVLRANGFNFDDGSFYNALRIARSFLDEETAKKVYSNHNPKMPSSYWVSYHVLILKNMGIKDENLLEETSLEITQLINNVERKYKINKDIKESLITLKRKFKIGLISNTSTDFRKYLNDDGILHLFDVIGLSYEMALWKPDKRIFWECCRVAGTPPQNSVYVGDSLICDFNGALNAGMTPILISQHTNFSKIQRREHIVLKNVSDLLKILELTEESYD